MQTQNLGYPRIGNKRELKKASEAYWAGKITAEELQKTGKEIRLKNWKIQKDAGIDLIPSNDFSFYDQMLDTTVLLGAVPKRYTELAKSKSDLDLYFAMARGFQKEGFDLTAMEMTKWFDTNYHYIVPEFTANQDFPLNPSKILSELKEAQEAGIKAKSVLIGPVTYLLLGKEKEDGFHRIELLSKVLPVYSALLKLLQENGVEYVQIDEPCLALDLTEIEKEAITKAYSFFAAEVPTLKIILANYFDCYGQNIDVALNLPVDTLHIDLVRCPLQLEDILKTDFISKNTRLSLGVVDGRNIWKNDFEASLKLINEAKETLGFERVLIAPSSSLLHSPCDLDSEKKLNPEIKNWMAFARQKVDEISTLKRLASGEEPNATLQENKAAIASKKTSVLINNQEVKERVSQITENDAKRKSGFAVRKEKQNEVLGLPLFPTTTIGSFPQTPEVRSWRARLRKGELSQAEYDDLIAKETAEAIKWQEDIGMDVLVHGEFERNDMVEYFGEKLEGFVFTENGWVQSYGSRCVKPPVIFGDVSRPEAMTLRWTEYAQSLTEKWVKGMLTGPVTILQWSFVRNDQPRRDTCMQIALAIRDEVVDLEKAGIRIIQIDEPAIREGLPLRKENWRTYLDWAVRAFRVSASGVEDATQIHTHMCYSEFNDIIQSISDMDADVITIECSRSQMELLDAFHKFAYPNDIGPGVYDIHSPRVPSEEEMVALMEKARKVIPDAQLWVNPDCGLKTRHWEETRLALEKMVAAAKKLRA
jgi:5-methyltetrahydropteroyltriglutamate--homocysteine methyltransferase